MRVSLRRTVALLSLLVLVSAACAAPDDPLVGGPDAEAPDTDAPDTDARARAGESDARRSAGPAQPGASAADATREDAELVIWADGPRAEALRPFAEAFSDDHAVSVAVQELPFEQIRDQFPAVAPDGDGPDLIIGAHDWLGELVPAGMVAPVDLGGRAPAFADVAVSAVTYDGRTYGVPYALSSVALLRNTRHVPTAPETWEDLVATARALRRRGAVSVGLTVPGDPYHLYPLVTALGGYLFGRGADGGYDVSDLGIDSPGGRAAADRFREWAADGVIDFAGSGVEAQDRFRSGDAAFAILGPTDVDGDGHGVTEAGGAAQAGTSYEVSPVPPVDGGTARPFVGVEAVMVSAFAVDADLAGRFLRERAATEEAQAALAGATGLPPAHRAVAATVVDDPDTAGFAASARQGEPLPAVPETASAWGPWAEAFERVRVDGSDSRAALSAAADEIGDLIGR